MMITGYEEKLIKAEGATIGIRGYSRGSLKGFSQAPSMSGLLAMICADQDFLLRLDTMMKRSVVSMDIRGQVIRGSHVDEQVIRRSHLDEGNSSIKNYIADIDAVRMALKVDKISLFGYSIGSFFLAHYAIANKDKIAALILAEPAILIDDLNKSVDLAFTGNPVDSMRAILHRLDPSLSQKDTARLARQVAIDWQSPELMGRALELLAKNQLTDKHFSQLNDIPVLLIAGSESHMKSGIERIVCALPSANVWWIKGATHLDLLQGEYSKQIAKVTDQFLDSI